MAAYRKVNLCVHEVRASDVVCLDGSRYRLEEWSRANEVIPSGVGGLLQVKSCNTVSAKLQKLDGDTLEPVNSKPITVVLPMFLAIPVEIEVP